MSECNEIERHRYEQERRRYEPTPQPVQLWEIFVPTVRPNGKPISTRYHRVWDEKVRGIAGGLTILTPTKGQWVSPEGGLFVERMIPVRVACTEEQINRIADLSAVYYDQEAIFFFRVSDHVRIKHYPRST